MTPFEFMKAKQKSEWHKVAIDAGTSPAYFEQIARGYSNASISLAKKIAKASLNEMTLQEIIPALQTDAA